MVREEGGEKKLYYKTGLSSLAQQWQPVQELIRECTVEAARDLYFRLTGIKNTDPPAWVFNDFGPIAIRYFKDLNRNRKLDARERLSGEMIHTTPIDEANTARGLPVNLGPSHGCIHIKPIDRDCFLQAGAFARGTDFIIHTYDEPLPKGY